MLFRTTDWAVVMAWLACSEGVWCSNECFVSLLVSLTFGKTLYRKNINNSGTKRANVDQVGSAFLENKHTVWMLQILCGTTSGRYKNQSMLVS